MPCFQMASTYTGVFCKATSTLKRPFIQQFWYYSVTRRTFAMTSKSKNNDHRKGSEELVQHFKTIRENQKTSRRVLKKAKQNLDKDVGDSLVNHEIFLRVISTGSFNSCKSVLLQTEFLSYMFNCGDGILRNCFDSDAKWSKLEHLFITHKSYKNLCGTLELSASMTDVSNTVSDLFVHGCGSLTCMIDKEARTFGRGVIKSLAHQPSDQVFEDHVMTSEPIRLYDQTDTANDELAACAFKLTFKPPKRKVDTDKLVKFCLKPGAWIRQLLDSNEPVEVNGRTVTPEMVLRDPPVPGSALVVDCPTLNHLASLMEHKDKLTKRSDNNNFIDTVVHMTPDDVSQHPMYQQYIALFPSTTVQIMLPDSKEDISLKYAWDQQVHLNLVDKDIFPFLHPKPVEPAAPVKPAEPVEPAKTDDETANPETNTTGNVLIAKPGLVYNIVKKTLVPRSMHLPTIESALDYFTDDQRQKVITQASCRVSCTDDEMKRDYPVVTMLGTGGSRSTRVRNTTGILVEISKDNFALLDCGYGILGQLTILYGSERTQHILRHLGLIFVSHGHADHHGGLLALLCNRKDAFGKEDISQLRLICPAKMLVWFHHLDNHFDRCMTNISLIPCDHVIPTKSKRNSKNLTDMIADLQLNSLETINVKHAYSVSCFGISLQHKDWKLVFSGDTMPCEELVTAAKGADLLIHEATFGDSLDRDARLKTHCTTSQALDVARRCEAKFTLLTHFSNRHQRVPEYSDELLNTGNVGIAFDNMILRPKDLPNTTYLSLYNVLQAMYPKYMASKKENTRSIVNKRVHGMSSADIVSAINEDRIKTLEVKRRKLNSSEVLDVPTSQDVSADDAETSTSAQTSKETVSSSSAL